MVGLASRARGDDAGTRAAFERGIRELPKAEMPPPDPPLVPVAEWVGGQLLGGADAAPEGGAASSLAGLRLCVGVLRAVATAQPGELGTGRLGIWTKRPRAPAPTSCRRGARRFARISPSSRRATPWRPRPSGGSRAFSASATTPAAIAGSRTCWPGRSWASGAPPSRTRTGSRWAARWCASPARRWKPAPISPPRSASLRSAEAVVQALPEEATRSPRIDEIRRRLWWGIPSSACSASS